MKAVLLFLSGIFLFAGCNNLCTDVNPPPPGKDETDFNYTIPGELFYYPNEFWISLDHTVTVSGAEMSIMFFYLTEEPDTSYNVTLWIAYEGGRMGDDMIEFNTKDPANPYYVSLWNGARVAFEDLSIKRNKIKVKVSLTYPDPDPPPCNPV
ncbi:MAG TPA: hypothetical protein VHO03_20570 [Ignavibacteriales bacterium]|nr:hypothetical protein [Ignavibacteriales bacterium]